MMHLFKYYFKQFKEIKTFRGWDYSDKAKFMAITNIIILALAMSFPANNWLQSIFTLFFLVSISYFTYEGIKLILSKFFHNYSYRKRHVVMDEVDQMSSEEFTELLVHLLKHQGYRVNMTPRQEEFGADLTLRKGNDVIVVQAKRQSSKVGVWSINEVVSSTGYYRANKKWIITNSYFTNGAIKQAQQHGVILHNREYLLKLLKEYNNPGTRNKKSRSSDSPLLDKK